MKTIAQQQSIPSGKYYIILGSNLEYNDETYSEWGEKLLSNTFYKTLEEAKAQRLNFIIKNYGWQEIYTIDQWQWDTSIEENLFVSAFLQEVKADSTQSCSETLENFISFLKMLNVKDDEIIGLLPNYFNIYEIELS